MKFLFLLVTLSVVTAVLGKKSTSRDCIASEDGSNYQGEVSKTKSGLKCQKWSKQTPHKHDYYRNEEGNYCRNPNSSGKKPWCYTADPDKRWEYCDIPLCKAKEVKKACTCSGSKCLVVNKDCLKNKRGNGFTGTTATTKSGKTCQSWSKQTPHKHRYTGPKNYCANPDDSGDRLWCYTTDENTRWEYCDIPTCPKATKNGLKKCGCNSNGTCKKPEEKKKVKCSKDQCGSYSTCSVESNKIKCGCKPGFKRVNNKCKWINPCKKNPCGSNSTCNSSLNTKSFTCGCKKGFKKVSKKCQWVNPCTKKPCGSNSTCRSKRNKAGHTCGCKKGFKRSGSKCNWIDPCSPNPCGSHSTCSSKKNRTGHTCGCKKGFKRSGSKCNWINPCSPNPCGSYSTCSSSKNRTGHTCGCKSGYKRSGNKCNWINPCDRNPCRFSQSTCSSRRNTQKYTCGCKSGYKKDGNSCQYISTCSKQYTKWNKRGGGNPVYLDRHRMLCSGNKVLNQFQLKVNGNQIRYEYICCTTKPGLNWKFQNKQSSSNIDGGGNIVYLDRIQAKCSNGMMGKLYLYRPSSSTWRYDYSCSNLSQKWKCQTFNTPFTSDGGGKDKLQNLKPQKVSCPTGYGISWVHLNRNGKSGYNKIRYSYRCCIPSDVAQA